MIILHLVADANVGINSTENHAVIMSMRIYRYVVLAGMRFVLLVWVMI